MNPKGNYRLILHAIALFVSLLPLVSLLINRRSDPMMLRMALDSLLVLPFYILNIWILVPQLLSQRRYGWYGLAIVGCFLVYMLSTVVINHLVIPSPELTEGMRPIPVPNERFGRPVGFGFRLVPPMIPFFANMAFGSALELVLRWDKQQRELISLEKENLQAELKFLRTQINPHFLFNTLNSIYSLALSRSATTPQAVMLLSNLMRYLLYESNVPYVTLSREMDFLNDFLALQKIRMDEEVLPTIDFTVKIADDDRKIAPLILLPFIENAFKHSATYQRKPEISIKVVQRNDVLLVHVSNTIGEATRNSDGFSGIGMLNIQKRLQLLYQDRYQLSTGVFKDRYVVDLSIKL